MNKTIFLYSGEGTKNSESKYTLIRQSKYWSEIEKVFKNRLNLNLEDIWNNEIDKHRCPYSPLLTVASQICLSDIWTQWGYEPDVVIGHSIGELTAAFQAGFYSLEEILTLTYQIGNVASKINGTMLHGKLTDHQIEHLPVHLSSLNFTDGTHKHVTLSGYANEMASYLAENPDFVRMKLPHPWHHFDYRMHVGQIMPIQSKRADHIKFVSGVTTNFEAQLADDHWRQWMVKPIDFIKAMQSIKSEYNHHRLEIIEIGFHPVLDKCCEIFDNYKHVSSMFRGEDEIKWILYQRQFLDRSVFLDRLKQVVDEFKSQIDCKTPLAYQGFNSLTFMEFSVQLQNLFPSLAPQDFYRYKTIDQLVENFRIEKAADRPLISRNQRNEVVVSGMSCKFPSSIETLNQFWEKLLVREDQIKPNSKRGSEEAGYLDDQITKFDHKFFNIPDAEAKTMDPQQILALELTELLWKDAGIDPESLDKNRIGVYIGVWNQEYLGDKTSVYYPTGTNPSIIASRISYHYDLRGPSWVSNTACSSSLVAVHYAAKDIEDGRVDYAIAGGVNMLLGTDFTARMRNSGFLSKDHRCRTFDDSATGYVRAEGGGLVLLMNKTLARKYYAELIGSSVNQNGGRSQVITAPHPQAQEDLINSACRDAAISPGDISYIECHGTGTKIGDPIEISAIQNTISKNRDSICHVGSVKTNIGHLESAAGIAGLIKSVLVLNNGVIPPNLHYIRSNQLIDFDSHHLKVVSEKTEINKKSIIGVSSFGFGGTNAHVIIKGVDKALRKKVENIAIPFDRTKAIPLERYFEIDSHSRILKKDVVTESQKTIQDVGNTIRDLFFNLTNSKEVDPEVELFEQGLDSMSATELLHNLEKEFAIELDPDILFDYPLFDQIVKAIATKVNEKASPGKQNIIAGNADIELAN